jgi:hypothetical protein
MNAVGQLCLKGEMSFALTVTMDLYKNLMRCEALHLKIPFRHARVSFIKCLTYLMLYMLLWGIEVLKTGLGLWMLLIIS